MKRKRRRPTTVPGKGAAGPSVTRYEEARRPQPPLTADWGRGGVGVEGYLRLTNHTARLTTRTVTRYDGQYMGIVTVPTVVENKVTKTVSEKTTTVEKRCSERAPPLPLPGNTVERALSSQNDIRTVCKTTLGKLTAEGSQHYAFRAWTEPFVRSAVARLETVALRGTCLYPPPPQVYGPRGYVTGM